MLTDSKIVKILKFGSTVQKLFNVEKRRVLHCFYGVMAVIVTI